MIISAARLSFLLYCDVQDFSLHQSDRNQPSHTDLGYSLTCRTNRVVMLAQRSHVETFFCDAVMMPEVKVVCSDINDTLTCDLRKY